MHAYITIAVWHIKMHLGIAERRVVPVCSAQMQHGDNSTVVSVAWTDRV